MSNEELLKDYPNLNYADLDLKLDLAREYALREFIKLINERKVEVKVGNAYFNVKKYSKAEISKITSDIKLYLNQIKSK